MPPLPLFRLPGLVLFEVFKSLSIGEKINLSLCSKKISTQINNARLCSQKVIVNLDMLDHGMRVRTENNRDTFDIFISLYSRRRNDPDMQQCQIDGHTVPLFSFTREIDTFWKNYYSTSIKDVSMQDFN
ncbi:hypothetical protein CRE_21973 [Caenorhabditis remanei]|uniref:F-box domain-containing protein n=1 Tax=Caenorhabditis remanei TaxID=31234 RepID=E3N3D4_CAERE|nr:hypothetical protein CRE_21973 [Caenorhabditis remanei]